MKKSIARQFTGKEKIIEVKVQQLTDDKPTMLKLEPMKTGKLTPAFDIKKAKLTIGCRQSP